MQTLFFRFQQKDVPNGHTLSRLKHQHPLHRVQALQPAGEGGILSPLLPLIGEKVGDGDFRVFPLMLCKPGELFL